MPRISYIKDTPSSKIYEFELKENEEFTDEEIFKMCDSWYDKFLGGIIKKKSNVNFEVIIYTD